MPGRAQLVELCDRWKPALERFDGAAKHIGLMKVSRSSAMAASAATAYAVRNPSFYWTVLGIIFCVFAVCSGAATLNNYQDRHIDEKLQRTRMRPLVTGEMGCRAALIQALILLAGGILGLVIVSGSAGLAMTALIGVCSYNLIYTPLKRRTSLAIIPGAVCGVLPILMGWMAAGGELASPKIWILIVAFGVWQFPHFWLVLLASREDYGTSGIPNMLRVLPARQLSEVVFVWVAAFALLTLLLPLFRVVLSDAAAWILLANALVLTSVFSPLLFFDGDDGEYRHLFRHLSLSAAVVMSVIMVDGIA